MIWKILEIDKTFDEEQIKLAYRNKLPRVNPEDDQEGFKQLRNAYEKALEYASQGKNESVNEMKEMIQPEIQSDVEGWLMCIDKIYQDITTRIDVERWKELLESELCEDIDTEMEISEKLLVYLSSHFYMPQEIWILIDHYFGYMDGYDLLIEKFPEDYLNYVRYQINHKNSFDYTLFYGKTDDRVDDYINLLYEIRDAIQEENLKEVEKLFQKISFFDIRHPYADVEKANYLIKKQLLEDGKFKEEALAIMEELDFEYSHDIYIERNYANILIDNEKYDKAKEIFENIVNEDIGEDSEHDFARLGIAKCEFFQKNYEFAKELVEDILEEHVQDMECLDLLEKINQKLIPMYEEEIRQELNRETYYKLGWCYYQCKEFQKGIDLISEIEVSEDYDYINLKCRLYLANEDYETAYMLTKKWIQLIEEFDDETTKEYQKRKNRISLAYFSLGVCLWEILHEENENKRNLQHLYEAYNYIRMGIEKEKNELVGLSYMEQLARYYIFDEKYKECVAICNDIIKKDPRFFPAYVHRQKANYELKNAKEVIDDYYICRDLYPDYSRPYLLAIDVFMIFEQYDDAESIIKEAKERNLNSDGIELARIKCSHYQDDSDENLKINLEDLYVLKERLHCQKEETDIEDLADVEKELAIIYWDLNNHGMALEILDCYLDKNPDSITILDLKVDMLNREHKYEDSISICQRLVQLEPDNLYTRLKLGNSYERNDDYEMAIKCYEYIVNKNNKYILAIRRLMYLYSYFGEREENYSKYEIAVEYATRLIEETGTAEGYVERGNLYIGLYELEKAVEDCKKAIELDPEAFLAYNNLGCALLKLRRTKEALEPLEYVIKNYPEKDIYPYLNLGEVYYLEGEYEKSIAIYKDILRIWPNRNGIEEKIIMNYRRMKQYEKVIDLYGNHITKITGKKYSSLTKQSLNRLYLKTKFSVHSEIDDIKRILYFCMKIAKVYQEIGEDKNALKYVQMIENIGNQREEILFTNSMRMVIEYYRDTDSVEKAYRYINKIIKLIESNQWKGKDWFLKEYSNDDILSFYFVYITVLYEMNNRELVKKYASMYIEKRLELMDGEEGILRNKQYSLTYLYELVIVNICEGNLGTARRLTSEMRECKMCVMCEYTSCFEYYFAMGFIAQEEGRKDEAIQFYKHAIEINPFLPFAKKRLQKLEKEII